MKWKVLESEYLFERPWLTVRKDVCELPNGKKHQEYYVLEYPSWVTCFALTEDGKVILVKQYRHGLGVESIELPGGVVDEGEALDTAVKRELLEETGYEFSSLKLLGKISANPATTNNYMHMYLATGGKKIAEQKLDETEDVEVQIVSMEELKQLIRKNAIVQSLHMTCMFYAMEKLGELKF